MQDMGKMQNLSGVMLVFAFMFAIGTFGLASVVNRHPDLDDVTDGTVSFETLQECEQKTDVEVAAHFDQEVRVGIVESFCSRNKESGLIENIPVSAAGIATP